MSTHKDIPKVKRQATVKKKTDMPVDTPVDENHPSTVIMEGVKKFGSGGLGKRIKEIKPKGLSLSIKFALVISLVSASLCFIAELWVYFKVKDSLLQEIDRKGNCLARAAKNIALEYYDEYVKVEKAYQEAKAKSKIKKDPGNKEPSNPDKEPSKGDEQDLKTLHDQRAKIKEKFTAYLTMMISRQEGQQIVYTNEILNIAFIVRNTQLSIPGLLARQEKTAQVTVPEDTWNSNEIKTLEAGKISTEKGTFDVRTYSLCVVPDIFCLSVMLSKSDIARAMDDLWMSILITTFVAIAVGVGISFLLAGHVTHPVSQLIKDIEVVGRGNLEHKTTAISTDEIGILAYTFNVMTQGLKTAHATELEKQAREHELQIATEIQECLLPSQIPQLPGYDIFAFYQPSKEVGGDYYDFIEIDNDHIGFIVADVSGKGVPGSMVMTMARALIRMEALRNMSPAKTFLGVNKVLSQDIRRGMFVTSMYGVLTISTGEFVLCSAGHNPAVVWRNKTKQHELVNPKSMALGLDKGTIFEKTLKEQKIQLYSGDRVVFYTDGVTEAMSPSNEEFGDDRFINIVAQEMNQSSNHLVDTLVQSLKDWRAEASQSDDITIVTFARK